VFPGQVLVQHQKEEGLKTKWLYWAQLKKVLGPKLAKLRRRKKLLQACSFKWSFVSRLQHTQ
jgi:hypothetical protein